MLKFKPENFTGITSYDVAIATQAQNIFDTWVSKLPAYPGLDGITYACFPVADLDRCQHGEAHAKFIELPLGQTAVIWECTVCGKDVVPDKWRVRE